MRRNVLVGIVLALAILCAGLALAQKKPVQQEGGVAGGTVKGEINVAGATTKGFSGLQCHQIAIDAVSQANKGLGPKWERHARATGSWASGSCSYQVNVPADKKFQVRLEAAMKVVPCGGADTLTSTPPETGWMSVSPGGVKTEDFKLDSVACIPIK